jgi:predicted enzyme related to lactoylglutathione lyase
MHIGWITAFVDVPSAKRKSTVEFWCAVTGSQLTPWRGDKNQFATFLPPDGDAYLRIQCVETGDGRIHLDFHVADVSAAVEECRSLGAQIVADHGYVIMSSPGGFVFCLVSHGGEPQRPTPFVGCGGTPSLVDQICLDVPTALMATEKSFWAAMTGWQLSESAMPEFSFLNRPDDLPWRILLQDIGSGQTTICAHIDIACGPEVDAVSVAHQQLGAEVVTKFARWTTMRDPVGTLYCLTRRDPVSVRPG